MNYGKEWGLYVYEQDWLFTEFVGTNATLSSATLSREWLMQMGMAAQNAGIVVQYCMLWPRMALQSLELPAVTTARGSTDYKAGGTDQWIMGLSSLFLDSLALRPTKDNYFSTDRQGCKNEGSSCKKGIERFNRLQALVSTLSTGPVFPSDAIGDSDVALILRSCTKGGVLLRPDQAATSMDKNILQKALALATGGPDPGELEMSHATVGNFTSFQILAANTAVEYEVTIDDLPFVGTKPNSLSYLVFEANSTDTLQIFGEDAPLRLKETNRWNFTFHTIVPTFGYTFLGEVSACVCSC